MRRDAWAGMLSSWSCQSSVAHTCGLLNHPNSFCGGMFKLNAKSDADLLPFLLSHFESNGHTVHMLTQWCLPPPLTSTVKSSLFVNALSSSPSLAARLHWCCANHSRYINNGLDFFQTSYIGWTLHWTRSVWWFVAFVEKIVSSLVRLLPKVQLPKTGDPDFPNRLLKAFQDAPWTESLCSMRVPLSSPVNSSVLLLRTMETSGLELKNGMGVGTGDRTKGKSYSSRYTQ